MTPYTAMPSPVRHVIAANIAFGIVHVAVGLYVAAATNFAGALGSWVIARPT